MRAHPIRQVIAFARRNEVVWIAFGAVLLGTMYAASLHSPFEKYHSPDETANAIFSRQVAQTGGIAFPSRLGADVAHPRSVVSVDGETLLPATFLGLPFYYGWVGRLIGWQWIWLLTPALAAVAVVCFYLLLRSTTSRSIALLATALLSVHPVFWFYASRGFWHNSPFVSWLTIGAYFLWTGLHRSSWRLAVGGVAIGLALAFRTVEVFWVGGFTVLLLVVHRHRLQLRSLVMVVVAVALPILPVLLMQGRFYEKPLTGAYEAVVQNQLGNASSLLERIVTLIAPFGWHPGSAFQAFVAYGLQPLFPTFALGLLCAVLLLRRPQSRWFWYSLSTLAFSTWMILYYGSFVFQEIPLGREAPNLGSSYLRYWLPLIVAVIPLSVKFLLLIQAAFRGKVGKIISGGILVSAIIASVFQATVDPAFGFAASRASVEGEYQRKFSYVMSQTPANAIVVASLDDKIYWPQRRVVGYDYGPVPDRVIRALPRLAEEAPVYFITTLDGEAERVNRILQPSSYAWREQGTGAGVGTLYLLVPVLPATRSSGSTDSGMIAS